MLENQESEAYAHSMGITPAYVAEAENAYFAGNIELAQLAGLSAAELQALYLHAYAALRAGKAQQAARLFLALTQFDRRQARFYVGLGLCFQHMHEFGWAQGIYRVALQHDPQDRIALCLYGECAILVDGKAHAHDILSTVIAMPPRHPDDVAYLERAKGFVARLRRDGRGKAK